MITYQNVVDETSNGVKMPNEAQKKIYNKIMDFYNVADKMIDHVESYGDEGSKYSDLAFKFVEVIDKNTEILIDNFLTHTKAGRSISALERVRMDKARQEIENELNKLLNELGD